MKIRQCFLELQLKMLGMFFLRHTVQCTFGAANGGASLDAVEAECALSIGAASGRRRLSRRSTLSERVNFSLLI